MNIEINVCKSKRLQSIVNSIDKIIFLYININVLLKFFKVSLNFFEK